MPHNLSLFNSQFSPPPARHYHPTLSIWLSVDPMADKYPGVSPYVYCGNNPVRLVDPDGMWGAEINEDGTCVMFRAEEGDDLNTLATQLGVSLDDLSNYEGTSFAQGQLYSFDKINKVQDINKAISLMNNGDYNCANFAMFSNGILQESAFGNDNDGVSALEQAAFILCTQSKNVSENDTRVGDIVTFGYTEEAMRRENPYQNVSELYTPKYTDTPAHYGIVLLKSKDGLSVSEIIEKPGRSQVRISNYSGYSSSVFTPRPQTNGKTPFYNLR